MLSIIHSSNQPRHLPQLREWFVTEWGHIDLFEGVHTGFIVPAPLLVIDSEKLVGGLAFTSAPKPGSAEAGVWINALLVLPAYRGRGIGSQLVQAAEIEASRNAIRELFVFTSLPKLYRKLGWQISESKGEVKVLSKRL